MTLKRNWLVYLIIISLIISLAHQCSREQKETTKTVTKIEYVKVTDTINTITIQKVPINVYIDKEKYTRYDSIIYVSDTINSIKANQYQTELKSNNALANLSITTPGELLDVSGTITYTQENKTVKTTKTKALSGAFLYGQVNLNGFDSYGIGIDYQIKNTIIIGTSINYDNYNRHFSLNVKLGFKL